MTTTTIKSTNLDFSSIKNNLKTYLAETGEFADYDFEGSALSSLLDVLAANTHYNALIANFALNESFLDTAQLRGSVVSLSEGLGYIPDSRTSAVALAELSASLASEPNRPPSIQMPSGFRFRAAVDGAERFFQTRHALTARDDGAGRYAFADDDGNATVELIEGTEKVKTFIAQEEAVSYVVPDPSLDLRTVVVRVHDSPSSSSFTVYQDIRDARVITGESTLYVMRETPTGNYELNFAGSSLLGRAPTDGNKITVTYLSSSGEDGNGATSVEPLQALPAGDLSVEISATVVAASSGGGEREDIEAMRRNAPHQYAAQNRMVTANDYAALALRNFSSEIEDIKSFGGEDAPSPKFGTVYMSVLYREGLDGERRRRIENSILDLAEQLSVVSFNLEFAPPVVTYLESRVFFHFNPELTSLSRNRVREKVDEAVADYFARNTGRFDQSFHQSALLSAVDETSPAVLSSRSGVRMQQRIVPELGREQNHDIRFPVAIRTPGDAEENEVASNQFIHDGRKCIVRNAPLSSKLEVYDPAADEVVVDNAGSYSGNGVSIVALRVDSIDGPLKISAAPANDAIIAAELNNILEIDSGSSFSIAVETDAEAAV